MSVLYCYLQTKLLETNGDNMDKIRPSDYRIEAGQYRTRHHLILWGGSRCWQVRDGDDEFDMIDYFPTLREALRVALAWDEIKDKRRTQGL